MNALKHERYGSTSLYLKKQAIGSQKVHPHSIVNDSLGILVPDEISSFESGSFPFLIGLFGMSVFTSLQRFSCCFPFGRHVAVPGFG